MPLHLAAVGEKITQRYVESRDSLFQQFTQITTPLQQVLLLLNQSNSLPQLQDSWGGAQYPKSFYSDGQTKYDSLQILKEKINAMRNPKQVIQKAQQNLESQTQQKLLLAQEAERKTQQQYQLIEQEKQRLEQLDRQLQDRSKQLKDYENQLIIQQQKVTQDLQQAGARYKQQLSGEIEQIRNQKLEYEQTFAKEKAIKEQELINLQQELNSTQQSIQNITQQYSDVQSTRLSNQRFSKQCWEQIQNAHNDVIEHHTKQQFLVDNSRQLSQSLLTELQDNTTLTGQCIMIPQIQANENIDQAHGSAPSVTLLTDQNEQNIMQKSIQEASRRQSSIESELESQCDLPSENKQSVFDLVPAAQQSEYKIPKEPKNVSEPVPVADWARGEILERCVLATYATESDKFFQAQCKTSVQELFGIKNHPFDMKQRQTQNWGKDKLSQKEIDQYKNLTVWRE